MASTNKVVPLLFNVPAMVSRTLSKVVDPRSPQVKFPPSDSVVPPTARNTPWRFGPVTQECNRSAIQVDRPVAYEEPIGVRISDRGDRSRDSAVTNDSTGVIRIHIAKNAGNQRNPFTKRDCARVAYRAAKRSRADDVLSSHEPGAVDAASRKHGQAVGNVETGATHVWVSRDLCVKSRAIEW